jgi:3-hydroxyacyl-CoA dehydrogenase/enoyl-CoA hydratase/3-hydroxybutyryl-CoA epimerase/enoyl-CoA isomerase
MLYQGQAIQVSMSDGVAELVFDRQGASVNKFDRATLLDLSAATAALEAAEGVAGLVVHSGKSTFIVGADITEFGEAFSGTEEALDTWLKEANAIFNRIEDLPFPTVTAINGTALGGGFEMCLSTDYRVLGSKATIGQPETKLGIIPGFGGTVRLPRLIGADNAIDIIASGRTVRSEEALKMACVDAVVGEAMLLDGAKDLLGRAISGEFDYKARRAQKMGKLRLSPVEGMMVFNTAKGFIKGKTKGQYPAPIEAIKCMERSVGKTRDAALDVERKGFIKVARTTVAAALTGLFLNDQLIKKKSKEYGKIAHPVKQAAVLGAGIMGGGIAYQSAYKDVPILMKDIREEALQLGEAEASKLLGKLVKRGRIDATKMGIILSRIRPTLSYGDFGTVDVVVEAVVENQKVKQIVLGQVEAEVKETTILASNTSSISITALAEKLERPENFCGMHFFNPVHRMPLVEIIRGEKTSEQAIATVVAYAAGMGKTPIVVNDCPGFLVNRILFPYFAGFQMLVNDGADFAKIDKTMEKFGWPMGPAYLLDVVGMDTAHHVADVLAAGYPDRMANETRTSLDIMYEAKRFGQKNSKGFYQYAPDRRGKPKKSIDPEVAGMLAGVQANGTNDFETAELIDRMMIPMIIETARCLEEGIVDTANEADMGLIMGLGFPPFRGGALKYADTLGLAAVCETADKYAHLGKLYEPTAKMREMAASGATYY